MSYYRSCVVAFVLVGCLFMLASVPRGNAQQTYSIETPDRKFVFIEDQDKAALKKLKKKQKEIDDKRQRLIARRTSNLPFDISGTSIEYDSANKTVVGKGGVIIGYPTGVIEADEVRFNTETDETEIKGDVRIDDLTADIIADSAKVNLRSGRGTMENAKVRMAEGGYTVEASHVEKLDGESFSFKDMSLSTCKCPDGGDCLPWRISGTSGSITREGYGKVWNGVWHTYGVPSGYSPFIIFPAKTETQSGLLPMSFGQSKRKGFSFFLPLYLALSKSMEATITGVLQTNARQGAQLDYRGLFSKNHLLEFGGVALNESQRNGDLMGTNVSGLYDPSIDTDRFGGYLTYYNFGSILHMPTQVISDGRYVTDDLLIREYQYPDIGSENNRYLTSEFAFRLMPLDNWVADTTVEYNQAMVTNDDFVFQKLPMTSLHGFEKFSIFGENNYGLKLITDNSLAATNYDRMKSYDGTKSEWYENLKIPFYYKNYIEGAAYSDIRLTKYNLRETQDITETVTTAEDGTSTNTFTVANTLPDTSDRLLPGFGGSLSTVVERVFDVSEGNPIKTLADLGPSARKMGLQRIKHTIQPIVKYRYLPDVDQSDTPLFDSYDHLAQTNVITFQLNQRLFGRFEDRNKYLYGIEEAAPTVDQAGFLQGTGRIDRRFASGLSDDSSMAPVYLTVPPSELVNFSITESYDVLEQQKNLNPDVSPWSDLGLGLTLLPNSQFRLGVGSDYNHDKNRFTDVNTRVQLQDKLGDELRARLTFRENLTTQLETSVQLNVIEWAKVGYYSRFDEDTKSFIESRLGLRLKSTCNCWILDFDIHDRPNPDETLFNAKITFIGLGGFGNTVFSEPGMRLLNPSYFNKQ